MLSGRTDRYVHPVMRCFPSVLLNKASWRRTYNALGWRTFTAEPHNISVTKLHHSAQNGWILERLIINTPLQHRKARVYIFIAVRSSYFINLRYCSDCITISQSTVTSPSAVKVRLASLNVSGVGILLHISLFRTLFTSGWKFIYFQKHKLPKDESYLVFRYKGAHPRCSVLKGWSWTKSDWSKFRNRTRKWGS